LQDWCEEYGKDLERLNVEIDRQKRQLEHTLRTSDDHQMLGERLATLYGREAETARRYLERRDALEEELVELRAALEQLEDSAAILGGQAGQQIRLARKPAACDTYVVSDSTICCPAVHWWR
jgi:GAF domain-containing protein